uniref:uncharacterized protein LOC118529925 isoform X8 n=1 Tax=Halichoerus grypus TaxID=9711 RepID=UPI001658C6EC|nr:uncharacterized protein LOC118529925 isoform X8 [Halichoerus grypus]
MQQRARRARGAGGPVGVRLILCFVLLSSCPGGWDAVSPHGQEAVSCPEDSALTWKSVPRRDRARWECSRPGPGKKSSAWPSDTGKVCSSGWCLKDCSGRMMTLKM